MLKRPVFGYDPASNKFSMVVGGNTIKLWRIDEEGTPKERCRVAFQPGKGPVVGMTFVDADTLITVHEKGQVVAWEVGSIGDGEAEESWSVETDFTVASARGRGGGEELAIGGFGGEVLVLRLTAQGASIVGSVSSAHVDKIEVLAFSADGGRLATSGRDREIGIWSTHPDEEGGDEGALRQVCRLKGSGGWPLCVAFSQDGRRLASGCMDNGTYVWDLEAGERTGVRYEHHGWVGDVTWLPGDETVVSASWDETIGVFQAHPLRPKMQFMHHDDYVVRVVPIRGTELLAAASYDATISVWNWRKGQLEGILEGHRDWVTELLQVGDKHLLSLSSDRTARLWSVETMSQVAVVGDSVVKERDWTGDGNSRGAAAGGYISSWTTTESASESNSLTVVRQFNADNPMVSTEEQDTAANILEQAIEESGGRGSVASLGETSWHVDADLESVGVDAEFESAEKSDELVEEGAEAPSEGLGDELSSLVLDAISDVEESKKEVPEGVEESEDVEDRAEDGKPEAIEKKDSVKVGDESADSEDVEDQVEEGEPETTQGAKDVEEPVESEELAETDAPAEIEESEVEKSEDAEEAEEEPAVEEEEEELTEEEEPGDEEGEEEQKSEDREDEEVGLGIMDSFFDPVSEGQAEEEDSDEELTSTSSPEYDPQPLESPEEVQPFLPDDDILELAFAKSGQEASQGEDDSEIEAIAPDEKEPEQDKDAGIEKPVEVERDSKSRSDSRNRWARGEAQQTLTRGKPLIGGEKGEMSGEEKAGGAQQSPHATPHRPPGIGDGWELSEEEKGTTQTPFSRPSRESRRPMAGMPTQDDQTQSRLAAASDDEVGDLAKPSSEDAEELAKASGHEAEAKKEDAGGVGKPSSKKKALLKRMAEKLKDRQDKKESKEDKSTVVEEQNREDEKREVDPWIPEFGTEETEKTRRRTTTLGGGPKPVGDAENRRDAEPGPMRLKVDDVGSEKARKRTSTAGGGPSPFAPASMRTPETVKPKSLPHKGEPGPDESAGKATKGLVGADVLEGRRRPEEENDRADGIFEDDESESEEEREKDGGYGDTPANQTFMGRPGKAGFAPVIDDEKPGGESESEEENNRSPGARSSKRESGPAREQKEEEKTAAGGLGEEKTAAGGLGSEKTAEGALGEEKTAAGVLGGDKTGGDESNTGRMKQSDLIGLGVGATSARLRPSDGSERQIEGSDNESSKGSGAAREVALEELWKRAKAAPEMGILRRRIDAGVAYDPAHQLKTGMRDEVAIAVSPQEKRLVAAGSEGKMGVWSVKGDRQLRFSIPGSQWRDVGFVDGERLIYAVDGRGKGVLALLPSARNSEEGSIYFATIGAGSGDQFRCGRINEEGEYLLTGSEGGEARLWNLESGKSVMALEGHKAAISAVAFGKKGPVTASVDGQIRFWNRQGFQFDQIDISGEIVDLAASEGLLLWTEASGALRLMKEGASRATKLQGHYGEGRSVAFRDDGYAVAGGEDGRLLVYDGNEGALAQEVPIPAPIHRVLMKRKVLAASCVGGVVFVFRRVAKKSKK